MGIGNMICSLAIMTVVLEANVSLSISSSKLPHRTKICRSRNSVQDESFSFLHNLSRLGLS
jgi:hypothetical protein